VKKVRQIFLSLIVVALCAFPGNITNADDGIAESAEKVRPIGVGSIVPNASVRDISGNQVELSAILNGKPTILIFYRGGWCP
jgi:cytochrome oxidase Cu insertion factor (SCO1/SenC/PrrC family)